jgi:hypothetical protein
MTVACLDGRPAGELAGSMDGKIDMTEKLAGMRDG